MVLTLRRPAVWAGSAIVIPAAVVLGVFLHRGGPGELFGGMPPAERAYWSWVRSINEDPSSAVASGLALLEAHPHLSRLYFRLAALCGDEGVVDQCRAALAAAAVADTRVALYRDAALTRLSQTADAGVARRRWLRVASSPVIDATLARYVVDEARNDDSVQWLPQLEAVWRAQLAADSSLGGVAFGLGYAAVRRGEWEVGEGLLDHALRLTPDEPHVYRELGRVYYSTARHEKLIATIERGLEAARAQHDIKQQLVMRGNLGLGMLQWTGDLEAAGRVFEQALYQARQLSDGVGQGVNLYRLATVRTSQNHFDEALRLLNAADERYSNHLPQQRAEVLSLKGRVLADIYRFSESEQVLAQAVDLSRANADVLSELQALQALLRLRYNMGQYAEAAATGLETLALAERYGAVEYVTVTRTLLGDVEVALGNFDGAARHYQAGLDVARESKSWATMSSLFERLGYLALQVDNPVRADSYFDRLLRTVQEHGGTDDVVRAYRSMALMHGTVGNHDSAITYFDMALSHLSPGSPRLLRARVLRDKAVSVSHTGDFDAAVALMHRAGTLASGARNEQYRVESLLADIYLRSGNYSEALDHVRIAEELETEVQWSYLHWSLLHRKGVALWQMGHSRQAEQAFTDAIQIVEALRDHLTLVKDRASYAGTYAEVYETYAAFLEQQGRTEEAFHFSERSRSRSLGDLLYTTQAGHGKDALDPTVRAVELRRRLRALDNELALEEEIRASTPGATHGGRGNRAVFLRRERLRTDSLYRDVELELSDGDAIYTFDPVQPRELQALLAPQEAMIAYDLRTSAPGGVESVAHLIRPDTVIVRALDIGGSDLAETIRFFRDHLTASGRGPGTFWTPSARRLYDELVAPLEADLPDTVSHLHVVPEGLLHYLPFAALVDSSGRFLVERYSLSMTPSASVLKLCRARNPGEWSRPLLVADPDSLLPGARREVSAIASIRGLRPKVLVGAEVTQERLEREAPGHDVIHFATHAIFDQRAPGRSHLKLSGDSLTVDEIGGQRYDGVYLVTLSACETALSAGVEGGTPAAEEWVGLNQAFVAAGAPSVLASLWGIDDDVSSQFMAAFYGKLQYVNKAEALAEVQRGFIEDPSTRHPFFWAPFTVFGDPK